jgi:hypothetical protein
VIAWDVPTDPALDAARLLLDRPIDAGRHSRRAETESEPPSGTALMVGYGAPDSRALGRTGTRRRVGFSIDGWGCDPRRARGLGCDPDTEVVVDHQGYDDACNGDSGGPLFEAHRTATGCSWRLLGIVSRPIASSRVMCGDGGVYVRADRLARWIESPF